MADSPGPNVVDGVPEPEKAALIAMLEQGRANWLDLIGRAGPRVGEPGPAGEWTLRDVMAHINAYHRFLVSELGGKARPFGDTSGDTGDVQKRNELMHAQDLGLSWEFLVSESEELHQELLRLIQGWTQEELARPMVTWQPWPRWRWIINLTIDHYEEHNPGLRAWLAGLKP